MKTAETTESQRLTVQSENVISLPLGLLGFERVKKYVLLSNPQEEPFMWLQMLDDLNQSFLVIPPCVVDSGYQPDIAPDDVDFLGIESSADAIVLNIVTVRENKRATVNMRGPIVLNRNTLVGKQVIPINANDYALQHPLPEVEEQ